MKKASEITFGIEIECNIPNDYAGSFPRGSYHHGVASPVLPSGWNTQSDGSVRASDGYFAAEIVSPVLTGEAGLTQVVEVLDLLNQIGAKVNASCGLHVHVGCGYMTGSEKNRMVKLFKAFENAFYLLNGEATEARLNSMYCAPSSQWNGSRYASLNLTNCNGENGHFEVRVWAGTLEVESVLAAIYMTVSLASAVTNEAKIKTSDLPEMTKTQAMAAFIRRIIRGDQMIVPDLDPADLFRTMMVKVQKA